jgi:hypothetical protein
MQSLDNVHFIFGDVAGKRFLVTHSVWQVFKLGKTFFLPLFMGPVQ